MRGKDRTTKFDGGEFVVGAVVYRRMDTVKRDNVPLTEETRFPAMTSLTVLDRRKESCVMVSPSHSPVTANKFESVASSLLTNFFERGSFRPSSFASPSPSADTPSIVYTKLSLNSIVLFSAPSIPAPTAMVVALGMFTRAAEMVEHGSSLSPQV